MQKKKKNFIAFMGALVPVPETILRLTYAKWHANWSLIKWNSSHEVPILRLSFPLASTSSVTRLRAVSCNSSQSSGMVGMGL